MRSELLPEILYHYTTNDGLLGILREKALWATNILFLNDASELSEPLRIAEETLTNLMGYSERKYKSEDLAILDNILKFTGSSFYNTFVASFCQQVDLLSQWRGYGIPGSAYAIGFDTKTLREIANMHGFDLVPCTYKDKKGYVSTIRNDINNILRNMPDDRIPSALNFTKRMATLKLDCFKEEQEWRLISNKFIANEDENLNFRASKNILVPYYSLPLGDGSSIVSIVIGPTPNPELTKGVIHKIAEKYDIKKVNLTSIRNSDIPYRLL